MEKQKVDTDKIKEFWLWFSKNENILAPELISDYLIDELNKKILSLSDLNWEIGEGIKKDNMLVISPGGDINLLDTTKQIIKLSPILDNWEFYDSKPPKSWDYTLSIKEHSSFSTPISVRDWEYILLKFPDETFDIDIKADNLKSLSNQDKFNIAEIVLESILGEETSITYIKNIKFVDEFDKNSNNKNSITVLKSHLDSLIS